MPIVTNVSKREERIKFSIEKALAQCQKKADEGKDKCFCIIDSDIRCEVIDAIEEQHGVWVKINYGNPSRRMIERIDSERVKVCFTW